MSEPPKPTTTLAYTDRAPVKVRDTVVDAPPSPPGQTTLSIANTRSTVLPRVSRSSGGQLVVSEGKPRYEPVRHLGAGGQAEVTLVRDHDIDRTVAVKRLLPDRNDDGSVLRFAEEIRTVGRLEHPNIVPIHDVGVDETGNFFFVMKYVEGETLESIIAKLRAGDPEYQRKYTIEARVQIANEILRGVQHAHELGILHRDLKPANVMIGSLGEVVVMDWGLAKRIADGAESPLPMFAQSTATDEHGRLFETQAGALLGTPAYMSPEQASGQLDTIDVRSDIYSLAIMFYELFSLRHPRAHCTTVAEMIASVNAEAIGTVQILGDFVRGGASAGLAHFVRHGLAQNPGARYQSVSDMRARLGRVRDGRAPIECHCTFAQSMLNRLSRSAGRHPLALALLMLVLLVGTLGGVGLAVAKLAH